ncbi:MAG: type II toxin-antitoxin system PemK/MazF family toxin [Armatimonadetes bacterium]|nr:type II toxin-antitoxin system PemK/MazF family toxin [Armatimonadota bacterium]
MPLTTNVARLYPGEAPVMVRGRQHKAQVNFLSTVSKQRVSSKLGELSRQDLAGVERAVSMQLDLA